MSSEVKDDLRYTKDHEWARVDDGEITIGITAHAVEQLGDITLVNLDVGAGDSLESGKEFGTVESVKTLADLFSPVKGRVTRINDKLEDAPELVNDDCYGEGWMISIEADRAALDELMEAAAYRALLESL
ncbi:MAG: glycine cleavage system protein GcvH [Myxococcota bacterium]